MVKAQSEKFFSYYVTLVRASRLETGIFTMSPTVQPLSPLLDGAVLQAKRQALDKGVALAAAPTEASACFDPKWTAEALYNVVDNAGRSTPRRAAASGCRYGSLSCSVPWRFLRRRPRHPRRGAGRHLQTLLPRQSGPAAGGAGHRAVSDTGDPAAGRRLCQSPLPPRTRQSLFVS